MGVKVTPQAIDQRFSPAACAYLKDVLEASVSHVVSSDPVAIAVLERFSAVTVQDSSVIELPDELEEIWRGFGGSNGKRPSAIKLHVRVELKSGMLDGPILTDGRSHDQSASVELCELPPGGLRLADLGYFNLGAFEELGRDGTYYISRYKVGTRLFYEDGSALDLASLLQGCWEVDIPILMGANYRLDARLMGVRVPKKVAAQRRRRLKEWARKKTSQPTKSRLALCDWTLLVTNVPADMLCVEEALVLARARWQIELLFKLWKQHGQIDEWRTTNPFRILCELYAKLVAMVIQHWILLVTCWRYPDKSLVKASQTVRSYAPMLASAIGGFISLSRAIEQIAFCIAQGCRMNSRRRNPNTYQLLLQLTQEALN